MQLEFVVFVKLFHEIPGSTPRSELTLLVGYGVPFRSPVFFGINTLSPAETAAMELVSTTRFAEPVSVQALETLRASTTAGLIG